MKKSIGIGIVGYGNMGKVHSFCIENIKYFYEASFDAHVVGITASNYENAKKYAERYSFPKAFQNASELIASPEVDVVDICTPNIYHYDELLEAVSERKNIYCEKPLCTSYEKCLDVTQKARLAGVLGGVVFNTRFLLPVIRAKEIIDAGMIGDIISFDVKFLHSSAMDTSRTGWKQDKSICGGGVLFDLGSHAVDLTRYLCGDFSKICGKSQIAFPSRTSYFGQSDWKTDADEAFYISATLKCGAEGNITVGKIYSGTNDDFSFEIYGTKGHVRFTLMEPNWLYFYSADGKDSLRGVTRIECVGRYEKPATGFPGIKAPVGWLRGHLGSMYNFLSCISENKEPLPSFEDAAQVQKVLDAAYLSDSEGRTIYV